jgi:NADH-quinone oxidoreductase subunit M
MEFYNAHILSVILFTPLAGALLMLLVPRESENAHRWLGNIFGFLGFAVSVPLVWKFDEVAHIPGFLFVEYAPWIPSLGADYRLGIDGISFLLIMLTTLLGAVSILSSWSAIQSRVKEYYILLLLLQVGMLGVFMSLDFFLFYVFWEVMLVPMYFLIGVWGSDRRLYAAIKFFLYTLAGSVLMLLAILAMYFNHAALHGSVSGCVLKTVHDAYTFNIDVLISVAPSFGTSLQQWLFWGLFFAFAIKVPMFPFHTWLPDAHTEAPTAGSVILAAVLLKMGTYGFLRFSVPMFPEAVKNPKIMGAVITLSIIAIIYGALVCLMQKDMKKLIAYSSVSHMGLVTLGIFVLTPAGIAGSVIQQINHGLSTGMLFLIVGVLYERRHTRLISEYGGISTPMPNFAAVYLIASLSSLGMPVLNGFIGEFVILQGVFEVNKMWAAWGALGIVLGAAYLLWLYQRVMYGPVTNPANEKLADLNFREMACFLPLIALCFWIGVYPKPFFRILDAPVKKIVLQVNPDYYNKPAIAHPVLPPPGEAAPAVSAEGK